MSPNERLIELRRHLRLTQAKMAEKIRVTRSYYSLLETGAKPIVEKTLARLQETLNVNPAWMKFEPDEEMFLPTEEPPKPTPEEERAASTRWILDRFRTLPEEMQKDLLDFAEDLLSQYKQKKT